MFMKTSTFTRKISAQTKWMFLLVLLPLYVYCASLIGSALIKLILTVLSTKLSYETINCWLNVIVDGGMLILVGWVMKDLMKKQLIDFKQNWQKYLLYGIVLGTGCLLVAEIFGGTITSLFGGENTSSNQELINTLTDAHPALMILTSVFLAPILEEMMFRGIVFSWLYEVNPYFAHLVSAFLFGFVHIMSSVLSGNMFEWVQIFSYFFMGIVLSVLYEKTNNIYVPILTHATNNLISMILLLVH